jgi:hypothetical protein
MDTDEPLPTIELLKHLDNDTTKTLSTLSKAFNTAVNLELTKPIIWKYKLEKALGLMLPFGNHSTAYWKDLYDNLTDEKGEYDEVKLLEQLKTGKSEYVWIMIAEGMKISHDALSALLAALADLRDFDSLNLVFNNMTVMEKDLPFRNAIFNNDLEMFKAIFLMFTSKDNTLSTDAIRRVICYSITKGTLYILEFITSLKLDKDKYNWNDYVERISVSNNHDPTKARMLEHILKFVDRANPFELSRYRSSSLSKEAVKVMADSGKIEFNTLYNTKSGIDLDTMLILYMYSQPDSSLEVLCLLKLIRNETLLSEALNYRIPRDNIDDILQIAMRNDNNSFAILVDKLNLQLGNKWFHRSLDDANETPFLYICEVLDITVEQLENSIMLSTNATFAGKIPLFIKLGVSLKLVGEKLAFNANDIEVIKQLHDLGFSFDNCADDLMFHYQKNRYISDFIVSCLSFKPMIHIYDFEKGAYVNLSRLITIRYGIDIDNNFDVVSINWDMVPPSFFKSLSTYHYNHPEIKYGAKIVTRNYMKTILRGLRKDLLESLLEYLNMVFFGTSLAGKINFDFDTLTLNYGDTMRVTISPKSLRTKYRGLDIFSSDGYPLTTREAIKSRRRELLPR